MAKIALHQGSYEARSPIANAQSCINLYPESNPNDAPFPVTHYPAPGTSVLWDLSQVGASGPVRGLYLSSRGNLFAAIGTQLWSISGVSPTQWLLQGEFTDNTYPNLVSMVDNGTTLVVVDGSPYGYMMPLTSANTPNSLVGIVDDAFYGANRVDYIDTFMIFNQPGTGNFYTTTSGVVTPFDATYAAAKEGYSDLLVTIAALHDNIWLLGNTTTEIWYNAGGTTFPFARMPNSVLQQGCIAADSVVIADNAIYWLSQDRWGRNMCMRGEGYMARRVSTFAVENEWSQYPTTGNAKGMAFQFGGHEMIGFYFWDTDTFWVYDASTQMWHKRTYSDLSQAWLPFCCTGWGHVNGITFDQNMQIAGHRTAPQILQISRNNYTDTGTPIQRQRAWVHMQQDGNRIHHSRFSANMMGAPLSPDTVYLSWSDDAGQTYGAQVPQTCNNATNGQYQWRRLGYARDRVYQLNWSGAGECALNGAYVDVVPHGT